jgi:hypothetical protein
VVAGGPLILEGRIVSGSGRASAVAATAEKRAEHVRLFGAPLIGTLNLRLSGSPFGLAPFGLAPSVEDGNGRYWLVRLTAGREERLGWAFRWDGTGQPEDLAEVYTRELVPDSFRAAPLRCEFLERWSSRRISEWAISLAARGHRWWQSWPWLPPAALPPRPLSDSTVAWPHILVATGPLAGATLLDVGTNEGFFAVQAARAGAIVAAIDRNHDALHLARTIAAHVEPADVIFAHRSVPPDEVFDVVLELSVWHQVDPGYEQLGEHLADLRRRARRAVVVELMRPPLSGHVDVDAVVASVGGAAAWHRRHPVRRERTLYRIPGAA